MKPKEDSARAEPGMCNTASNSIQGFTSVPAADRSALPAMPSSMMMMSFACLKDCLL